MEGTLIGGYRILYQLGAGGMGVVWCAEHVKLGRKAAIKILHSNLLTRPDIVTRFFNEARAVTSIADPGIVQVFDFGQAEDGSAFIVMELLEGEPLDVRLKRQGPLPIGESLRIIRQVASSVGAGHAKGIVHRDLKPDNIFLVRDGEVVGGERTKVLDFGIAKMSADSSVTSTSTIMGTPIYMSPEQCRGAGQVDRRSDVYSLGCLLFRLIAGRPPYVAKAAGDLIVQHITIPAPKLSSVAEGVTRDVDDLVLRCMSKDPAKRYDSGTELATAIDEVAAGLSIDTKLRVSGAMSEPHEVGTTLGSSVFVTTGTSSAPRRTKLYVGVGAGALVAGVITTAVVLRDPEAPTAEHAPEKPLVEKPVAENDLQGQARAAIESALHAFTGWRTDHAGAPCPSASDLAMAADPWGETYEITCVDQPEDQMIGVRSRGPDRVKSTPDDLTSWSMGTATASIVTGARWVARPAAVVAKPVEPVKPAAKPVEAKPVEAKPVEPKPDAKVVDVKPTAKPVAKTVVRKPTAKPKPETKPKPDSKPTGIIDLDGDGIPDSR